MDVLLNDDEAVIRETAREFLAAECSPTLVRRIEKGPKAYCPDLWRKMADLGWLGIALPEQYGGVGLSLVSLGLILEEVGRAIAPVPLHSTCVAALTIARHGTEAQRQAILPAVARGDMILTWAYSEEDPRLVPEAVQMTAVADGDGFRLNGTKLFVDNFAIAEKCLVVCRTGGADTPRLSLFLVDTNADGVSNIPLVTMAKDQQSELVFRDVWVSRDRLIGDLHEGASIAEAMVDRATVLLCTQMLGAARHDAEMAFEYAKFRVAFGQPIGAFQAIQHMCADMLIWLDGGGLLTCEALWRLDQGLPAGVEVSQAKAFCNEKCEAVVRNSQIIHGGIGFMMEFDLHLWFRRVTAWTMRLGTTFEHRARVSRALKNAPGPVILGRPLDVVEQ